MTLSAASLLLSTLLVSVPVAVAVISTVIVQVASPGMFPAVTSKLGPPATAEVATARQVPLVTNGLVLVIPGGKEFVKLAPVSSIALGFVKANVIVAVPPVAIEFVSKVTPMSGA